MRILINFSTLKVGGGQNVALSFLNSIEKLDLKDINIFYFVAENSEPYKYLMGKQCKNIFILPKNPIKRILFEKIFSNNILEKWKIDIIYSYFGFGLYPKRYIQVSGVAVSNIFFPEINFWKGYGGIDRFKKYLIDRFRLYGIKKADALIFENRAMENRCKKFNWNQNTIFIKPSIIKSKSKSKTKTKKWDFLHHNNVAKGLFLCGWHLNKNILIVPKVASLLKKQKIFYKFIITAGIDEKNYIYNKFINLINQYGVQEFISIIEPVKKDELKCLYENINHVFLLSLLESFSNNIIEAWYFKKPLIISDAEWSREICSNAALYVKRDDVHSIANGIDKLLIDESYSQSIITNGAKKFSAYPSIYEKTKQEISFIRKVYEDKF